MEVLKVVSLITTFSIASLGGGYGLSHFLLNKYVKEEKVLWECIWILNKVKERFCRSLVKEDKQEGSEKINNLQKKEDGGKSGPCLTYWSKNISKEDSRLETEWWIRAKVEDTIKKIIDGEPMLGDLGDQSKYPQFSKEINIDFLKNNCDFKNKGEDSDWIIVGCPKDPPKSKTQ